MTRRTTATDDAGGSDGTPLSTDLVFDLLRNRERRRVLELLRDVDEPVAITTLVRHVAGEDAADADAGGSGDPATDTEAGGGGTASVVGEEVDAVDAVEAGADAEAGEGVDDGAVGRAVHVRLDHVHLPRLADAGVVEYDREAGSVRYLGNRRVETVLDMLARD